jgi:outer membrane lipoprotein SlyB
MTACSRFPAICAVAGLLALAGCGPSYSPDTYASGAVQKANKVDQGVVVGVRQVGVSADGTTGAVVGGAAGGILGSQVPGSSLGTAFGTLGGTLVGGIVGTTAEHAQGDTTAFEYIVRQANGDLLSVTQKDKVPLALGQHVLLINGTQARIVPDYTVPLDAPPKPDDKTPHAGAEPGKTDHPAATLAPNTTPAVAASAGTTTSTTPPVPTPMPTSPGTPPAAPIVAPGTAPAPPPVSATPLLAPIATPTATPVTTPATPATTTPTTTPTPATAAPQ